MQTSVLLKVTERIRLDIFLREKLPSLNEVSSEKKEISNSKIRRLIFSGNVFVNDAPNKNPSFLLHSGSNVKINLDLEKLFFEKQNDDMNFTLTEKNVIFEDDYIIVVNKPEHFPTEETIVKDRKNLHAEVVSYLHRKKPELRNPPYAGIIHRLDRDTSGVIIFSKQRSVNKALQEMFDYTKAEGDERKAKKTYKAVCTFSSPKKEIKTGSVLEVEDFLGRISSKSTQGKWGLLPEKDGGKFAKSRFTILSKSENKCLVEAHIFTGRTHQIRVHLSSLGLPILGDELYGGKKAQRIFLHSESLEINHPVTGEKMVFKSPLPQGFTL